MHLVFAFTKVQILLFRECQVVSHLLGRCIWNTSCQTLNKPFCMSFCPMLLFWMSTRRTSFFWDLKKWSTDTHDRISLWDLSARAKSAPMSVLMSCLRAISSNRCANLHIWSYSTSRLKWSQTEVKLSKFPHVTWVLHKASFQILPEQPIHGPSANSFTN